MDNKILDYIIKERKGRYLHVIEINDVYELQNIIENIYDEFILDFLVLLDI
jgi:SepF-like predicted cell division protein (DUF552 family)